MTSLALNVELAFGQFALRVDHHFDQSGITVLFGASGSGKTTLLRVIAGLERRARGTVRFGAQYWQGKGGSARAFMPAHRRPVGYVFQEARLFPHLTVAGNLDFADKRAIGGAREGLTRDQVIEALELEPMLARRPGALSGGEQQRVALGRALLSRPRLLLMDEPLASLDARRRTDILPYIQLVNSRFGVPIIYVTHAMEEVAQLADHMVVLSDGEVMAQGAVHEVLGRTDLGPATGRFEAGVLLDAVVREHDEHYQLSRLDVDDEGRRLSVPLLDVPVGTAVRLRVRARDVSLATEAPRGLSIRNVLPGEVRNIEAEPGTPFAEVGVAIGTARLRARVTRAAVEELGLSPGRPVYALVKSIAFDRRAISAYKGGAGSPLLPAKER